MIAAIVQARMGSTRLPGKVLKKVVGKPLLEHIVERLKRSKNLKKIIVATTSNSADKPIIEFCKRNNIDYFIGSENDVLDRYYQAAKKFRVSTVVRITADCPLIDPVVVDKILDYFLQNKGKLDFASNTLKRSYPDGLDVEVFSFETLEKAWSEAKNSFDREHVTPFICNNPDKFRVANVKNAQDLSALRWTVDYPEDLEMVRLIFENLYQKKGVFLMDDVLKLLKEKPEIAKINKDIVRKDTLKIAKRNLVKSFEYLKRAEKVVVNQTQTLSKGPTQFVQGVSPIFLERGKGSHVWDLDGNEYIDYMLALGPVTLGYAYPLTTKVITDQLKNGISFSLPTKLEVELAELLAELIPCAEMARFGKNGGDATSAAVRIARAYTNREKIAYCGYHGWQDWFIVTTERNRGVPKVLKNLIFEFKYNKIETLEKILKENRGEIAAVIMEPIGVEEPKDGFLTKVRELANEHDALLIFDEIVTGFRISLGGAQQYFNVIPDIACFGKGMANGMPISAVVGKKEIMKATEDVFFSTTFGGETLSLVSAIATIREMKEKGVIEHLWDKGKKLKESYNNLSKEFGLEKYTSCVGLPPHNMFEFRDSKGKEDLILKSLFLQETIKRGILFSGTQNVSFSHTDKDINETTEAIREAFKIMKKAIQEKKLKDYLEGTPVQPVFRRP